MGPIAIFDKSFLQSLSVDEAVWFDNFFLSNITPVFLAETLADLEKNYENGRDSEQEVSFLAIKTPQMNSRANVFHLDCCISDLLKNSITMDGRPIINGGKPVQSKDGRTGFIYEKEPEAEALSKWLNKEFKTVERQFARNWRLVTESINLKAAMDLLNNFGINIENCKSLKEAKEISETFVNEKNNYFERMALAFILLGIPRQYTQEIMKIWSFYGYPPLSSYAHYASFVLKLNIFFLIATSSNLLSLRKTNRIDLAYLYYLPFCYIFVSFDKFHKQCAPYFLRDNQEFIWGQDLKNDLKKIDEFYCQLPESEKEKGIYAIASYPPDEKFLITKLWDRFLPKWRENSKKRKDEVKIPDKDLIKNLNEFVKTSTTDINRTNLNFQKSDLIGFNKSIQYKRGKWWQVPKNYKDKFNEHK